MKNDKWNFYIVLEPKGGASIEDTFRDMQSLKEMGIADDLIRIKFNGTDLVAGIYDDAYQYFDTHVAVREGNKEAIISSLPEKGDWIHLSIAFNHINKELEKRDNETFSAEEIDEILSKYKVSDNLNQSPTMNH